VNLDARPPRQRLGAQARREAILAAATDAFAASTFDQVSIGAVASAAGASEALVHKYFEGKAGLYTEVVRAQIERLAARQRAADAALPPNTSARDRVRVTVETTLDHVQEVGAGWATPFFTGPSEPEPVQRLRAEYRARHVDELTARLRQEPGHRDRFAFVGFLGFLQAVSQVWLEQGCPGGARPSLVTAALGALEGALGDWGVLHA
jgi:AcrR family transcriptional regulator